MPGIFISYRREDSIAYAGRLFDRLQGEFPRQHLFMDLDTLEPGENFIEAIQDSVNRCKVLLAVIGKRWLDVKDSEGLPRLANTRDWVRVEIETALRRNIRVIPCLVGGMTMPKAGDLPASLAPLAQRHALALGDQRFHRDMDVLIETIKKVLRSRKTQVGVQAISPGQEATSSVSFRETGRMVRIPRGPFLQGAKSKKCTIEYDYWIDQCPVTNQAYSAFVEAGGYDDPAWWSKRGWRWRKTEGIVRPAFWKNLKWNQPTHPVVGVSFYEAEAFANWAKKRLPTEQEWEKAARSEDGRLFPWGPTFDTKKCNSRESGLKGTNSVRAFPKGKSPCGCYDMAGNVWEWCASWWAKGMEIRVLRGGSWNDEEKYLLGHYRAKCWPTGRKTSIGFRCALDTVKS